MTWEFELPSDASAIAEARHRVSEVLAPWAGPARLADVQLVVSELVTNSVRHGPGEPIVLRLATDCGGGIAGEVEDQGDGIVAIRNHEVGRVVGGLGLPIVDSLTAAWGVYPGSTHVWFRFD